MASINLLVNTLHHCDSHAYDVQCGPGTSGQVCLCISYIRLVVLLVFVNFNLFPHP